MRAARSPPCAGGEVTPERLGETGDAGLSDEAAERAARTCWVIRRRLGKLGETLESLDFSGMEIAPPSSFRRFEGRIPPERPLPPGHRHRPGYPSGRTGCPAHARTATAASDGTWPAERHHAAHARSARSRLSHDEHQRRSSISPNTRRAYAGATPPPRHFARGRPRAVGARGRDAEQQQKPHACHLAPLRALRFGRMECGTLRPWGARR